MPCAKESESWSGESESPVSPAERMHDEQCVQYTHEMPYDLQESIGRFVIRIVPLLYGGMFGTLMHAIPVALTVGAVVSAGMDLAMGNRSILRNLGRSLFTSGCPLLASMARGVSGGLNAIGIRAPASLRDIRCRFS